MPTHRLASPLVLALTFALGALSACSSDDTTPSGSGGAAGDDASTAGTGGATGGAGGTTASGGSAGAAGADAAGGTTGTGGAVLDGSVSDGSAGDGAATMTLTSAALTSGGTFQALNTCAGANTSPPLTWSAGPVGTMSYAVDLTDLSISAVHWVIWDIPAGTTSLPAALPGDTTLTTPVTAKQLHRAAFFGPGGAYRGPCPNGATHNYRFQVNAIGAATLAGVSNTSTSDDVKGLVQAASLGHGDLAGTSNAAAAPADAAAQ